MKHQQPPLKKSLFILVLAVFAGFCNSCRHQENIPLESPQQLVGEILSWLKYKEKYVALYKDFAPLDSRNNPISKDQFYKTMVEDDYFPLKVAGEQDSMDTYRLTKIDFPVAPGTTDVIRDWAKTQYMYFKMEGKPLPAFDFTDLDGNNYTSNNTRGKILVLKTWFIACKPCVDELPALNQLTEKYAGREDIVFLSLALDEPAELKTFLKKITFKYHTAPNQATYINNALKFNNYPTHLVVNKNGLVVKVADSEKELAYVLAKVAAK